MAVTSYSFPNNHRAPKKKRGKEKKGKNQDEAVLRLPTRGRNLKLLGCHIYTLVVIPHRSSSILLSQVSLRPLSKIITTTCSHHHEIQLGCSSTTSRLHRSHLSLHPSVWSG